MQEVIAFDLWKLFIVLAYGLILTGIVFVNLLLSFRMHYYYKNNKDPLKAVKYKTKEQQLEELYTEQEMERAYTKPLI
tara:strand:+ start:2342 stop:2575 length:234 start_codon:yes stop_codon:yes gene_type:complete